MARNLNLLLFIFLGTFTFLITSCGDDEPETSIPTPVDNCAPSYENQVASGVIDGKSFTLVDGLAEKSRDSTEYRVEFHDRQITSICDSSFIVADEYIRFFVPNQIGSYDLDSDNIFNFNFISNNVNNVFTSCGTIEIQSISPDNITGRLHVKVEGNSSSYSINGNFDISVCD